MSLQFLAPYAAHPVLRRAPLAFRAEGGDVAPARNADTASLCIGAQFMLPGKGGIARVARLTAQVALDEGIATDCILAAEPANATVPALGRPARALGGNRAAFALHCNVASLRRLKFVYDFCGTGRVHALGPLARRDYALWVHGIEAWSGMRADYKRVAHQAHTLFANSFFTRAKAERINGGFARAQVCWLGTIEDHLPLKAPRKPGPPTVFILSRQAENRCKGHEALIAEWRHIVAAVPDARLVIGGAGCRQAEIRAAIARSPVAANIAYVGFIPEHELPDYWRQADVFAMPSWGEGFGLVYIEAMRYGVPVIASIHDAGCEINLDGVTGYNVDQSVRGELAERVIDLLRNPARAAQMGRAGQARWSQHFSYSRFRARFAPLLHAFLRA